MEQDSLEEFLESFESEQQQQQQQQQQQSLNLQLVFCGPKGERQKKLEYIYRYVLRAGNNR